MTRARIAVAPLGALLGAIALGVGGCSGDPTTESGTASAEPSLPPPQVTVPIVAIAPEVDMRLAEGVLPPTNRWYSSLAFGEHGLPVFPQPLAFAPTDGGFTLGLTRPVGSERAILAPAVADVSVRIDGASGFGVVSHADPVAATLDWGVAKAHVAQGWPVVALVAATPIGADLGVSFTIEADGVASATVAGTEYGMRVVDGAVEGSRLTLAEGGSAQFFAVPDGADVSEFAAALGKPVSAVEWTSGESDGGVSTTLTYADTTVLTMPAERAEAAGLECTLGTYETIHGEFAVCAAGSVTWGVPAVEPSGTLDLSRIGDEERAAIFAALEADVAALPTPPDDSYFGAKALYRMANLLMVARELGDDAATTTITTALTTTLAEWGDASRCETSVPRCFVYDPNIRGIVGIAPAFGSEQFNDHHFHYGYFLYAAAVAVEGDDELAATLGPVFDQVAADIASGDNSNEFPPIRAFDPVAGHSWASGYAPFADGNNQESSSEAVAAWNGVALWARARGDEELALRAEWMLAAEADASLRLWLTPDTSAFPEYNHEIVSLEWGAKRDYATWFSAEPSAMLGILLIPAPPPSQQYLSRMDSEAIAAAVAEATPHGLDVQFGDYIAMLSALGGTEERAAAWDDAVALPSTSIDDANSRTYLLAWIASLG